MIIRPAEDSPIAGSLGSARADAAVADDVRGLLATGKTELLTYGPEGQRRGEGMRVFAASYAPRPRMLVFGAIDFAAAVARLGSFLGYQVTVCDARPVFATRTRFPDADEVIVDWPHRYLASEVEAGRIDARTVICVLTHDPKFDVPVLEIALRLREVGYVGAMGSRKTHEERLQRLREAGLTEAEIGRLSSPIGLDLGARTPEETAVSIAAEIIGQRWGGHGGRLAELAVASTTQRRDDAPGASVLTLHTASNPQLSRLSASHTVVHAMTAISCSTACAMRKSSVRVLTSATGPSNPGVSMIILES